MPTLSDMFLQDEFSRDVLRLRGPLSLRDVEKQIGISASTISRVERGVFPDFDSFLKICRFYNINPGSYLLVTGGEVAAGHVRQENPLKVLRTVLYELLGKGWGDDVFQMVEAMRSYKYLPNK